MKSYKELTAVAISSLQKNFNYCVAQNKGNSTEMARAIENIPNHCFNVHDSCGSWCNYKNHPDTYTHKAIGDGFKDQKLFEALKSIFNKLASKTNQFVAGTFSNPNESLNAIIVSKAPKSRSYGTSAASDIRKKIAEKSTLLV